MVKSRKLINESIRYFLGRKNRDSIVCLFKTTEIDKFDGLIRKHSLEGLFYYLYNNKAFDGVSLPAPIIDRWKHASWKNSFENLINDTEAARISRIFKENKIEYRYIKGASGRRHYPDTYVRFSSDIDFFIKQGDYKDAKALLVSEGYDIPHEFYENFKLDIPLEQYEEIAYEISFSKKDQNNHFFIDLQWDFIAFGRNSVFHELYDINSAIFQSPPEHLSLNGYEIDVVPEKIELYIMIFHYAFHHGFKGLKWMIDITNFLNMKEYDKTSFFKDLSASGGKLMGIAFLLSYDMAGVAKPGKYEKKAMYLDRLLPFEYKFYKSRLFKLDHGVLNSISHRMVKILLPYRHRDKIRALIYMLFNTDSVEHRIEADDTSKRTFAPFSLVKIFFRDIINGIRTKND